MNPDHAVAANARHTDEAPASDPTLRHSVLDTDLVDDTAMWTRHRVRKQSYLARAGTVPTSLLVVRLGCFKATVPGSDGQDQVVDFPMRGDWLGAEALADLPWTHDIIALDDSEVLVLPVKWFEEAVARTPRLRHDLYRHFALTMRRDRQHMTQLSIMSARQRVAHFLLYLSERFAASGYSARSFMLPMLRADIGSYLGIALESVSRAFSDMHEQGVIKVRLREIELLDMEALHKMAYPTGAATRRNTSEAAPVVGVDEPPHE